MWLIKCIAEIHNHNRKNLTYTPFEKEYVSASFSKTMPIRIFFIVNLKKNYVLLLTN